MAKETFVWYTRRYFEAWCIRGLDGKVYLVTFKKPRKRERVERTFVQPAMVQSSKGKKSHQQPCFPLGFIFPTQYTFNLSQIISNNFQLFKIKRVFIFCFKIHVYKHILCICIYNTHTCIITKSLIFPNIIFF